MQLLAVGTTAGGFAALAVAFDEGAGQHLAQGGEAADEAPAAGQIRVKGRVPMSAILPCRLRAKAGASNALRAVGR